MPTNPKSLIRKIFPTARRKLVEKSINNISGDYGNVLVIGAGADPYHDKINYTGQYITIDISDNYKRIDIVADALKLPFSDESFDCIIAIEVLEHLKDPFMLASEVKRTLTKNGTLLLTVPFIYHIHGDPFDYWRPTRQGLNQVFREFTEVKIVPQGNRIHVIFDLLLTSHHFKLIFFPVRILSHLLVFFSSIKPNVNGSTAPSGYQVIAVK